MKIAIAVDKKGTKYPSYFVYVSRFKIYEYSNGQLRLLEERDNPLGQRAGLRRGHHEGHRHGHMHGIAKYSWLRENVLPDVDAVIAAGACQTSFCYFTSKGAKMLFTDLVDVKCQKNT